MNFPARAFAILDRVDERVEFRHAVAKVVVQRVVLRQELSECAFAAVDPVGDGLEFCREVVDSVVQRWIVQELADGALCRFRPS